MTVMFMPPIKETEQNEASIRKGNIHLQKLKCVCMYVCMYVCMMYVDSWNWDMCEDLKE